MYCNFGTDAQYTWRICKTKLIKGQSPSLHIVRISASWEQTGFP